MLIVLFFCWKVEGGGFEDGWVFRVFFVCFFVERVNQTQLKWLQIKNKHDYSIFVNRIATLHDVFITCNIFCSKHTWGRDMFREGVDIKVRVAGPKVNRNAIDVLLWRQNWTKCLRYEKHENKMGVRQLQEAHRGLFGDTTDYFQIYSIYIYLPSDTVLWRGFYSI